MHLASPWTPRLADTPGRPAERLAQALEEDIRSGRVPVGARLPAHRDLAYRLSIGLGSVTKAYQHLESLGLVTGEPGRGMFVRPSGNSLYPLIDLSLNIPPQMLSDRFLAASLGKLARRMDASAFGAYVPPAGRADHRAAMAAWLRAFGVPVEDHQVLLSQGAQQALALAVGLALTANRQILVEDITYPGILELTRGRGQPPRILTSDPEGVSLEAVERALGDLHQQGQRGAVYLMPTLHNPTTSILPLARREALIRLARRYDAWILEDDVYAPLTDATLPPLVALAPERVFYIGGLSKIVSPGLRIGWLVPPAPLVLAAETALSANSTSAAPLSGYLLMQWLEERAIESLRATLKEEACARRTLAETLFAGSLPDVRMGGFHLWLPRPLAEAERLVAAAEAQGLRLLPPRAVTAVDSRDETSDETGGDPIASGVRLCLGQPPRADLERALRLFKGLVLAKEARVGRRAQI